MPFCPYCGNSVDTGHDFCISCGAPLTKESSATPRSHAPATAQSPSYHQSPVADPGQPLIREETNVVLSPVRVLGILVIVFIIAGSAFFVLSGSPLSGNESTAGNPQSSGILPVIGGCSDGMSLCRGKCVDLQTDPDNCGGCGFSVPYGESCINGQFSSVSGVTDSSSALSAVSASAGSPQTAATTAVVPGSCPSGQTSCDGACRDFQNDDDNCGACGTLCPYGQNCRNGQCLPPVTTTVATTPAPVTITPEPDCSRGEIICSGSCVNVFTSKENCGVCGRACGDQEICVNARCGPACAESGDTLCDDQCVDLDSDINNCGACGMECETFLPNAKGSLCSYGDCIITQCSTDYGDCNKILSDGCEINLRLDAGNCGSCGFACPVGQVCYNRQCRVPVTVVM